MLLNASQEAFGTTIQQVPVANKTIRVRFEFTQGTSNTPLYGEEQGFAPVAIRWPVIILNGQERKINAKI